MSEFANLLQSCLSQDGHFHHRGHVKLAWLYLKRYPALEAITRFCQGLKHYTQAHGQPDKYHHTLTLAYLLLVLERLGQQGQASWEDFAAANPDLLVWAPGSDALSRYYLAEILDSPQAREHFVLPRLVAGTKVNA